jgi:hypothetical protein
LWLLEQQLPLQAMLAKAQQLHELPELEIEKLWFHL